MVRALPADGGFVRVTTEDAALLVPVLAQRGASFWLTGRQRLDVSGLTAGDIARLAAAHNARVTDLETMRHPADDADRGVAP